MTDVKRLMTEIKKFVEASSGDLLDTVVGAFTGSEFATKIELKKNEEVSKYLRDNSAQEKSLKEINDYIILWLEVVQKKMMHQQLVDFTGAAEAVLKQLTEDDPAFEIALRDFKALLGNPTEFVNEFIALKDETEDLENRLSQMISLPVFEEADTVQLSEPFKLLSALTPQSTCQVLRIRAKVETLASSNETQPSRSIQAQPSPQPSPPPALPSPPTPAMPRPENYRPLPANISDEYDYPETLLVITHPTEKKANSATSRNLKLRG
ncbi:hypothetical protein EBR21_10415 [bacterium]|nr:hypothetical protein [bacterium]